MGLLNLLTVHSFYWCFARLKLNAISGP